jgi:nitroimidazol reductase NimA-like FMN-containing flavoprotein (pyridoxamine 5'-phosphate oxidase superfamily)
VTVRTKDPIAQKLRSEPAHDAPTSWDEGLAHLRDGQWYWLATVRPDGRPHVRPVLSIWADDAMYFASKPSSRKARNVETNAQCAISVQDDQVHAVLEGDARRVTDPETLEKVRRIYASKYEWETEVRDGELDAEYGAPTAGDPPFAVYQVTPRTAYAFGTEPSFSPTRWRF